MCGVHFFDRTKKQSVLVLYFLVLQQESTKEMHRLPPDCHAAGGGKSLVFCFRTQLGRYILVYFCLQSLLAKFFKAERKLYLHSYFKGS